MALVAAVLVAVSVGLVVAQRALLTSSLDDLLLQTAATLDAADAAAAAAAGGGLDDLENDDLAWQVVDASGDVLAASPALRGAGPVAPPTPARRTLATDGPGELDGPLRVVTVATDGPGRAAAVHVVGSLEDVLEAVGVLAASLAIAVPVASLLLGVVIWHMVGRALQPVEDIRSEVAAIGGSDLDRRVPVPLAGEDDEIGRLAMTMNGMLDRLQRALEVQRRFVADASHELRSPLTRIRTQLEVARPGDDPAALRASLLEDAAELGDLVDDLLFLARVDDPAVPHREEPVDLDEVVLEEVARARAGAGAGRTQGGHVTIDASGVSGAVVSGDRAALGRVVRNLLDNALRHASSAAQVRLVEHHGRVRLVVTDDGPGVPPADRERVFERFTRLDEARGRDAGGAGVGLAIVREAVQRHGGTVAITGADPGARVVVELPSAHSSARSVPDPHGSS